MKTKAIGLLVLLLLVGPACTTTVSVSVHQPSSSSALTGTNCKLQRELRNQNQQTDIWCWAASAHTVIEYLKNEPIEQCTLVDAVFRSRLDDAWGNPPPSDLAPPNCCMSTSDFSTAQANIKLAKTICLDNRWPEHVFDTEPYFMHFERYEYGWTYAGPQGLSWDEIVTEICADRPMISAIHFSPGLGGGAHTVVIGGYDELEDGSQWVHVYDPGYNTLGDDYYLWPYDVYLGAPGVFTHVRDYKNIFLP